MKTKGFTLVELLAVIALLGILSMIAIPVVDNALKSGRHKLNETQKTQIIKGAKGFFAENIHCLPGNNTSKCNFPSTCINIVDANTTEVTLVCLKEQGYLTMDITNLETDDKYGDSTKVVVQKNGNKFNYTVE